MSLKPAHKEIGYSIQITGAVGDTATLPSVLDSFYQRTDGTFTMIFDICFSDDDYNIFFGGHNGLSHFHLIRNMNSGNIDLILIDDGDNHRDVTWSPKIIRGLWHNMILRGTANTDDGLDLFVDFVKQAVAAQQNDVAYNATATMPLIFGDHDGVNTGGYKVTKLYFYNRDLSDAEIALIKKYRSYPTDFAYAWDFKRPNIGL